METIRFPCPNCNKALQAPAAVAGKIGKCSGCQTAVKVPEPALVVASIDRVISSPRSAPAMPPAAPNQSLNDTIRLPIAGRKTKPIVVPVVPEIVVNQSPAINSTPAIKSSVAVAPSPKAFFSKLTGRLTPSIVAAGFVGAAIITLLGFSIVHWAFTPSTTIQEVKNPFSGQPVARSEVYEDKEGNIKQHGPTITWHNNGQKATETHFVRGKKHGSFKEWYPNGQKAVEAYFVRGKEHGAYTEWYENGQKRLEGTNDNGVRHDVWKLWTPEGQLLNQTAYDHYVRHGQCITIEKDGKKSDIKYVKGLKNGPATFWSADGHKEKVGEFTNDLESGQWQQWHPNGQLSAQGEYLQGKQRGKWTFWHTNGQELTECEYRNGRVYGIWPTWNDAGKPLPFLKAFEFARLGTDFLGHPVYPWTTSLCFSPDSKILAAGTTHGNAGTTEGNLVFWELEHGEEQSITKQLGRIFGMDFIDNANILASNGDRLLIWDIATAQEHVSLTPGGDAHGFYWPKVSSDRSTIAAVHSNRSNYERLISVWKKDGTLVDFIDATEHLTNLTAIALNSTGSLLASGNDRGQVKVWEPKSNKELWSFDIPDAHSFKALAFRENNQLAVVCLSSPYHHSPTLLNVYNLNNGQLVQSRSYAEDAKITGPVAFDEMGERLVWVRDTTEEVINVTTGQTTHRFKVDDNDNCFAFSPDQKRLAVGGSKGVTLWDISDSTANVINP